MIRENVVVISYGFATNAICIRCQALGLALESIYKQLLLSFNFFFTDQLRYFSHYQNSLKLTHVCLSSSKWLAHLAMGRRQHSKKTVNLRIDTWSNSIHSKIHSRRSHEVNSLQFQNRNCEAMVLWSAFRGALLDTYMLDRHVSWCQQKKPPPRFCMCFWTKIKLPTTNEQSVEHISNLDNSKTQCRQLIDLWSVVCRKQKTKGLESWTGWALRVGISISLSVSLVFFLRYTSTKANTKTSGRMIDVFLSACLPKKLRTSSTCVQIQDPKIIMFLCASPKGLNHRQMACAFQ